MAEARLARDGAAYGWIWEGERLDRVWWPVAHSAVELPHDDGSAVDGDQGVGVAGPELTPTRA
ncbi:hypothetical protein GCM10010149_70540 [Nonomuraea roseoviolacea subsp. roseoviolacea]|uniref:hypothetical protein n=1 Tax=Nonomuraea roseoviolacea TaxID=103837 RepID=UPI0031DDBAC3